MQSAMPYAIEVQGHTVEKYGFEASSAGVMNFFVALQQHTSDTGIKADVDSIRANFMAPGM